MNPVHPKKLLLSKWTAVKPVGKDRHFIVVKVIEPELPGAPVTCVALEALFSKRVQQLAWRELRDAAVWRQGWL